MDVVKHRNQNRYPGQWMYVVEINEYVHLVPFVMRRRWHSFSEDL